MCLVRILSPHYGIIPDLGVHLAGVHNLRTIDDHHRICDDVKDRDVVIIGTSFIGSYKEHAVIDFRFRNRGRHSDL